MKNYEVIFKAFTYKVDIQDIPLSGSKSVTDIKFLIKTTDEKVPICYARNLGVVKESDYDSYMKYLKQKEKQKKEDKYANKESKTDKNFNAKKNSPPKPTDWVTEFTNLQSLEKKEYDIAKRRIKIFLENWGYVYSSNSEFFVSFSEIITLSKRMQKTILLLTELYQDIDVQDQKNDCNKDSKNDNIFSYFMFLLFSTPFPYCAKTEILRNNPAYSFYKYFCKTAKDIEKKLSHEEKNSSNVILKNENHLTEILSDAEKIEEYESDELYCLDPFNKNLVLNTYHSEDRRDAIDNVIDNCLSQTKDKRLDAIIYAIYDIQNDIEKLLRVNQIESSSKKITKRLEEIEKKEEKNKKFFNTPCTFFCEKILYQIYKNSYTFEDELPKFISFFMRYVNANIAHIRLITCGNEPNIELSDLTDPNKTYTGDKYQYLFHNKIINQSEVQKTFYDNLDDICKMFLQSILDEIEDIYDFDKNDLKDINIYILGLHAAKNQMFESDYSNYDNCKKCGSLYIKSRSDHNKCPCCQKDHSSHKNK